VGVILKKIIIIGAGVAGLSAGIYALKNGFGCEIYEQNTYSGGECTAWYRKGYTIDGAISWLTGIKKNTKIFDTWKEVGAFQTRDIVKSDIFAVIHGETDLVWYRDLDKLKKELLRVSPIDGEEIERLIKMLGILQHFEMPAGKPIDMMDYNEKKAFMNVMMRVFGTLGDICAKTTEEYCTCFKSNLIKRALLSFAFKDNLCQGVLITLASLAGGHIGWIKGGSKQLTDNMRKTFIGLGGKLFCKSRVQEIVIIDGTAQGIILANGRKLSADYVIPACDLYITMKKLLKAQYRDSVLDDFYTQKGYHTSSICQVTFGVNCDLSKYENKNIFLFEQEEIAGETIDSCCFTHYCDEKGFAPKGKSVVKTGLTVYDYRNWEDLSSEAYQRKKEEIREAYQRMLYKFFPETRNKIEMVDITTPLTYERFCGAYQGAYMAFMLTKETNKVSHSGVIKGISNMNLAGQWLSALGGLPDAVISGKNAVMRICAQEHLQFQGVQ